MLESYFKRQINKSFKALYPEAFIQKISDRFTPGIPDMFIVLEGNVTFIELKCTSCRKDGMIKIDPLYTPDQVLTARLITRAKGNWLSFIHLENLGMVVVGCDLIDQYSEVYIGDDLPLIKLKNGIYNLKDELKFYSLTPNEMYD